QVLMGEPGTPMEEEDFDLGIVSDPFGPDVEGPLGRFYRDHLHATRENIVTAGVVEVRSRDRARRGGSAGCDPCADGQRKKDGGHREETAHGYLPWKRAARDGWIRDHSVRGHRRKSPSTTVFLSTRVTFGEQYLESRGASKLIAQSLRPPDLRRGCNPPQTRCLRRQR